MHRSDARGRPRVEFAPEVLRGNARTLVTLAARHGVEIAGVTKAVAGHPDIARLMLESGVPTLADARLDNIRKLRAGGITSDIMLLRPPAPDEIDEAAQLADVFLMSDPGAITALAACKADLGQSARVMLMVDLGDLREGVPPGDLPALVDVVRDLENVEITGLGTNLACHLGVLPSPANMGLFAGLAETVEARIGHALRYLSGGNSSALALMQQGALPARINHLRLGESLLLARETAHGGPVSSTSDAGFALVGQVIERGIKVPDPAGPRGPNALGQQVRAPSGAARSLALVNLGAVDTEVTGLTPHDARLQIIGHSSDHLILDVSAAPGIAPGDELRFAPNYHALATAMSSPYLAQVAMSVPANDEPEALHV
ncbi:MAG: alanine racemase [Silicimonas sp.]|nr:alanine racemase [Silicimonas sp.]